MSVNVLRLRLLAHRCQTYPTSVGATQSRVALSQIHRSCSIKKSREVKREYTVLSARSTVPATHEIAPSSVSLELPHRSDNNSDHADQTIRPAYGSRRSKPLPTTCPGCGAFSQEFGKQEAGYYNRDRRSVRQYLKSLPTPGTAQHAAQDAQYDYPATEDLSLPNAMPKKGQCTISSSHIGTDTLVTIPLCDRCHDIIHAARGQSIIHPSVDALVDTIAESPFSRNHVYHVLDAADFPMSLIPSLHNSFDLARPRSQNRRARHKVGSKPTVSFLITRSDLLAPTKELVDGLLPYFQSVLRTALGRSARHSRLGNVHLVSAKRGWWTTGIKDEIWDRGGGNWMLGKVNVGKSNLFEVLFPKGSGERAPVYAEVAAKQDETEDSISKDNHLDSFVHEDSLLPPPQPETPFPVMPLVSSLPGTTASPIRLSFGNRRGELIDLPGLARSNLEDYVLDEHHKDLVMEHRPKVEQLVIKPGQSLLLGGGLVRITPEFAHLDPRTTMLAYPFVPIHAHVTSTEKAIGTQLQLRESGIASIMAAGRGSGTSSAGTFCLATDVTKAQAGTIIRAGVELKDLPFTIYSTDILIEGVGWVELICQIRKRHSLQKSSTSVPEDEVHPQSVPSTEQDDIVKDITESGFQPYSVIKNDVISETSKGLQLPSVEVFTPNGKHIAQRPSLGAWALWSSTKKPRKDNEGLSRRTAETKMYRRK